MPTYVYTTKDGTHTEERTCAVAKRPKRIKTAHGWAYLDIAGMHRGYRDTPGNWPMTSDALACHPNQVAEFSRRAIELGVPTEYTKSGKPILTSKGHRNAYMNMRQAFDLDAGYSDRTRP
jgi:hypothetical protein